MLLHSEQAYSAHSLEPSYVALISVTVECWNQITSAAVKEELGNTRDVCLHGPNVETSQGVGDV
jgi:hypothetical protein